MSDSISFFYFFLEKQWIFWLVLLWSLILKGIALWKAARNNQKGWFVAILAINTLGVLEILYIFVFGRKKKENKEDKIS